MIPITDVAVGFLMAWQAAVSPGQTALVGRPDSLPQPRAATVMQPVGLTMFVVDTVPRVRRKAVVYSDGYATRLRIHKTLSWGMLPLFAASYFSGDQLLTKGIDAPSWARSMHARSGRHGERHPIRREHRDRGLEPLGRPKGSQWAYAQDPA